jgi:CubicO group peptidase (beta-lactamase class C family)
MRLILRLARFTFLTAWLLDISVCNDILTIPIQKSVKAKRVTTQTTESTCKPPLPSLLLQLYPPSADDVALHPLLGQLENTASSAATSATVNSITVGVVGPQGLIWSKGFGKANANGTDPAPPNEHTIYRIASISKLFATMEGHVLSEKGAINWYVSSESADIPIHGTNSCYF